MKMKFLGKYVVNIVDGEEVPLEFNSAIFYNNTRVNLFDSENKVIRTFMGFCKTEYELEDGEWTPAPKTDAERIDEQTIINTEQDELIAEILEAQQ